MNLMDFYKKENQECYGIVLGYAITWSDLQGVLPLGPAIGPENEGTEVLLAFHLHGGVIPDTAGAAAPSF